LSKIPQARERLHTLAALLELGLTSAEEASWEIRDIIQEDMFRPPPVRRAPDQSPTPDEYDRQAMREYAEGHPAVPLREVGRLFGFDAGRVSEAIRGV
jgi:hypothetical protein